MSVSADSRQSQWAQAAEKLGLAILWPGYRTRPYGNPCDEAYLNEVLAEVASDYDLDSARLYLYGICSSGMTASMEAVRNPERYAALAHLNPVLHRVKNRYDDNGEFDTFPAYRAWLRATDPVIPLAALRDLPVWIIHDGVDPGHGPLAHAVNYVQEARAAGGRPRFDRNRSPPPVRFVIHEQQLNWLAQHRRGNPKSLEFSSSVAAGPLSRVFAERFILVEATGGTDADRAANEKLSAAFQAAWRSTNGVSCRVMADYDLTDEEEEQSHLVLLGNERTNRIWEKVAPALPIAIAKDGITVDGRHFQGTGLAIQAWFPHPTQPGKKVALLGGADLGKIAFGTLELALDGWFDFAIWDQKSGRLQLIAAERYDDL